MLMLARGQPGCELVTPATNAARLCLKPCRSSLAGSERFLTIVPRTVLHFRTKTLQLKALPVDVGFIPMQSASPL
jgi:hypothetical protein